jgi:hypothetical protein
MNVDSLPGSLKKPLDGRHFPNESAYCEVFVNSEFRTPAAQLRHMLVFGTNWLRSSHNSVIGCEISASDFRSIHDPCDPGNWFCIPLRLAPL